MDDSLGSLVKSIYSIYLDIEMILMVQFNLFKEIEISSNVYINV